MRIALTLKWKTRIANEANNHNNNNNSGKDLTIIKEVKYNGENWKIHNLRIATKKKTSVDVRGMIVNLLEALDANLEPAILVSTNQKKVLKNIEVVKKVDKKTLQDFAEVKVKRTYGGTGMMTNVFLCIGLLSEKENVKQINEVINMAKKHDYLISEDRFERGIPTRVGILTKRNPDVTRIRDLEESMELWLHHKAKERGARDYSSSNNNNNKDYIRLEINRNIVTTGKFEKDKDDKQVVSSVVLEVKSMEQHRAMIEKIIEANKEEFNDEFGEFFPSSQVTARPTNYKNVLMENNNYLGQTTTILVSGLATEAWFTTEESTNLYTKVAGRRSTTDKNEPLFLGVERTTKTEEKGTWVFTCKRKNTAEAHLYIEQQLKKDYIATKGYETFANKFQGLKTPVRISPPPPREDDDDELGDELADELDDEVDLVEDVEEKFVPIKVEGESLVPIKVEGESDVDIPAKKPTRNTWSDKQQKSTNVNATRIAATASKGTAASIDSDTGGALKAEVDELTKLLKEFREERSKQMETLIDRSEVEMLINKQRKAMEEDLKERDRQMEEKMAQHHAEIDKKHAEIDKKIETFTKMMQFIATQMNQEFKTQSETMLKKFVQEQETELSRFTERMSQIVESAMNEATSSLNLECNATDVVKDSPEAPEVQTPRKEASRSSPGKNLDTYSSVNSTPTTIGSASFELSPSPSPSAAVDSNPWIIYESRSKRNISIDRHVPSYRSLSG